MQYSTCPHIFKLRGAQIKIRQRGTLQIGGIRRFLLYFCGSFPSAAALYLILDHFAKQLPSEGNARLHHRQTFPHPVTSVILFLLLPPAIAPCCTASVARHQVQSGCLALLKEWPIRWCSGQPARASQACSLLGCPCQTRPAQYAPAKHQSGPPS